MKTALLGLAVLAASGCSGLDPNVGPVRVEQPATTSDAAVSQDAEPGVCETIGPDEVCFARDIRPIIDRPKDVPMGTGRGCKGCHSRTQASHNGLDLGGFDTTTLGDMRKGGGSSGIRIIVPGKPNDSVLVMVLRGQYGYSPKMPKGGPSWNDGEIQLVVDWIAQGAKGRPDE